MTTSKPKPRKPLDPYTLRYVGSALRDRVNDKVWLLEHAGFNTYGKNCVQGALDECLALARRFEREARAARKRT